MSEIKSEIKLNDETNSEIHPEPKLETKTDVQSEIKSEPNTQQSKPLPDYIKHSTFTSEIYKIELKNMPAKIGFSEMKQFLTKKGVKAHKIKLVKSGREHTQCYVTFLSEQDKSDAMEICGELVLKGNKLTVHHAVPHKDPHLKRTGQDPDISKRQAKKMKRDSKKITDPVEKVCGYYNVDYEQQLVKKGDLVSGAIRGLTKKMISTLPKFTKDRILLK